VVKAEPLVLTKPFELAMHAVPRLRPRIVRLWYQLVSALDSQAIVLFMNYGYAAPAGVAPQLAPADEPYRYGIQLYRSVVAPLDLAGRDVLEVGSGRGGGAAYLARTFRPRSYTGVDFASQAVRFCRAHHRVPGLAFLPGDAEALPFGQHAFDVVLNIESSHTYLRPEQFFREVRRVLRPRGFFCFADWRATPDVEPLRAQLHAAGMEVLEEEDITPAVVRALDLDNDRKVELIRRHAPAFVRTRFRQFAAVRGTRTYAHFSDGTWQYRRFLLRASRQGAGSREGLALP
jgi:SAM-dependent methyltransferase